MEPQEAYRIGFLKACLDAGLRGQDLDRAVEKAAAVKQAFLGQAATVVGAAALAPTVAALMVGRPVGRAVYDMTSPSSDPEQIKNEELVARYRQAAEKLRRRFAQPGG